MSFDDLLDVALDSSQQLPSQLRLGRYVCSWENGKYTFTTFTAKERPGFRKLTQAELRQLALRLQAAPHRHVILLDLYGHKMGCEMMQEMAAPLAALKGLQVLNLNGTCPHHQLLLHHALLSLCRRVPLLAAVAACPAPQPPFLPPPLPPPYYPSHLTRAL